MDDNSLMPFGKYKGIKMANVPAKYLIYMYETKSLFGELKTYIEANLDVLKDEIKKSQNEKPSHYKA